MTDDVCTWQRLTSRVLSWGRKGHARPSLVASGT